VRDLKGGPAGREQMCEEGSDDVGDGFIEKLSEAIEHRLFAFQIVRSSQRQ
jgi:hypothetical protein